MSKRITLDVRGKLTVRDTAGNPVKIIIKLAGRGYGNGRMVGDRQYQVCRHVEHINDRRSPAQLARRERFKAAVAAWQALPETERRRLKPALPHQPPPARPAFPDLSAPPSASAPTATSSSSTCKAPSVPTPGRRLDQVPGQPPSPGLLPQLPRLRAKANRVRGAGIRAGPC